MKQDLSTMKIAGDVFELQIVKGFSFWITFFTANRCDTNVSADVWDTADQAYAEMNKQVQKILKELKNMGKVSHVKRIFPNNDQAVH